MPTPSSSEGGGNTTAQVVASGKVLPAAQPGSVTVDTTTYADPIRGGGTKLTTLVFPSDGGALAIALSGDTFPRWLLAADAQTGFYMNGGSGSPYTQGGYIQAAGGNNGSDIRVDASQKATGGVTIVANASGSIDIRGGATSGSVYLQGRDLAALTDRIGFYSATPVVQPVAIGDAAGGAVQDVQARTALNSLLASLRTLGLIAT